MINISTDETRQLENKILACFTGGHCKNVSAPVNRLCICCIDVDKVRPTKLIHTKAGVNTVVAQKVILMPWEGRGVMVEVLGWADPKAMVVQV